jgi:hypothetical protein
MSCPCIFVYFLVQFLMFIFLCRLKINHMMGLRIVCLFFYTGDPTCEHHSLIAIVAISATQSAFTRGPSSYLLTLSINKAIS